MVGRFFKLIFKIFLWFFVVSILWVLVYRFVPPPMTLTMISNSISNIGTDDPVLWKYDWVKLDNISMNMQKAVVAAEDQKFPEHFGFDTEAIEKALEKNEKGGKLRGGSTISQQTAKNAFLWQGRTWIRKGLEAYFTLLIEVIWGKKRILEVYLNIIELGNGVYGVEAAAQKYFGKSAAKLSPQQSAALAAVLPAPKRYSVTKPGPYVKKRQKWILRQMRNFNGIVLY